jgi:TolA-binding protein
MNKALSIERALPQAGLVAVTAFLLSSGGPATATSGVDFDKAVSLYNQKHYEEAAASFESIVAKDPDSAKASYYAGLSYQAIGKISRARLMYERTAKYFPNTQPGRLAASLLTKLPRTLQPNDDNATAPNTNRAATISPARQKSQWHDSSGQIFGTNK